MGEVREEGKKGRREGRMYFKSGHGLTMVARWS